jgi:hypothetical protein
MNAFWRNRQFPQGLKPTPFLALDGAAKAAPLQRNIMQPALFHEALFAGYTFRESGLLERADELYKVACLAVGNLLRGHFPLALQNDVLQLGITLALNGGRPQVAQLQVFTHGSLTLSVRAMTHGAFLLEKVAATLGRHWLNHHQAQYGKRKKINHATGKRHFSSLNWLDESTSPQRNGMITKIDG